MVAHEGEHAVAAGVVGLEPVEQVAVGLEHVDVVLTSMPDRHVAQHEPVGAVDEDADVLAVADRGRATVTGARVTGLDDDVVGTDARALELQVAADAGTGVRDAVPVDERRVGHRVGAHVPADHRDQVGVIGAVELVLVRERARVTAVGVGLVLGAGRVEGRLRRRRRLGVDARHHHDAVVVVRGGHGGLDLAVVALREQLLVDRTKVRGLGGREGAVVGRPHVVAVGQRVVDRRVEQRQRVRLADHPGVTRQARGERRRQRASGRDRSTGARRDRAVGGRVRPVRRPLHVRLRELGSREDRAEGEDEGQGESPHELCPVRSVPSPGRQGGGDVVVVSSEHGFRPHRRTAAPASR